VSGKPEAVALGEKLFFEPRLSGTGSVLCATCHAPFRNFQDARARAFGLELVDRNTPTLVDARFHRWFGWDGAQDSLWAQSIRPLLDPREMRATPSHVATAVRTLLPKTTAGLRPTGAAERRRCWSTSAEALALVSGRTPFDDFPPSARRNQNVLFVGGATRAQNLCRQGNCGVCHFGPQFTNGEFADTGCRSSSRQGRSTRAGRAASEAEAKPVQPARPLQRPLGLIRGQDAHVQVQHRNFGEFRVPGLRGVARTAPYMHNGSLATLADVVKFYSELNEERLHADGEKILKPLHLTPQESEDLRAFLESLSPREPGHTAE
jgi:cytochrome c peroxidase